MCRGSRIYAPRAPAGLVVLSAANHTIALTRDHHTTLCWCQRMCRFSQLRRLPIGVKILKRRRLILTVVLLDLLVALQLAPLKIRMIAAEQEVRGDRIDSLSGTTDDTPFAPIGLKDWKNYEDC